MWCTPCTSGEPSANTSSRMCPYRQTCAQSQLRWLSRRPVSKRHRFSADSRLKTLSRFVVLFIVLRGSAVPAQIPYELSGGAPPGGRPRAWHFDQVASRSRGHSMERDVFSLTSVVAVPLCMDSVRCRRRRERVRRSVLALWLIPSFCRRD